MSEAVFKVSQSKVKAKRTCNRQYHNRYVKKLRKKVKPRPLMFGTIVHKMIEAHTNGEDPMDVLKEISKENRKLFAAEREMYGDIVDDARIIVESYLEYWPERELVPLRKNGRYSELPFEIEIFKGVIWKGKIDSVCRTPNKLRWLTEHKTFSRMPNDDERWRNLQSCTYIRALEMLGWFQVEGTVWDYIRSKSPPRPDLLQNGTTSTKKIDTLPLAFIETLAERGEKTRPFKGIIETLEENQDNWFKRIHTPIKKEVVDIVFNDFIATTMTMMRDHGTRSEMNIGRHCSWCDYEELCRAELQGNDVEFVKERHYYVEEEREDNEDKADRGED